MLVWPRETFDNDVTGEPSPLPLPHGRGSDSVTRIRLFGYGVLSRDREGAVVKDWAGRHTSAWP